MIRAFIAIPLDDAARSALLKIIDTIKSFSGVKAADVTWVAKENIHLTLQFLGNIDEQQVKRVKEAMDVLRSVRAFRMDLQHIGAFPSLATPRVLWIGIKQQEQVKGLFDTLQEPIRDLSREDRPFSAHITLGRVHGTLDNQALDKNKKLWDDTIISSSVVDRVVLFQSILSPQGAVYRPIYTVDLKKEVV